MANLRLRQIPGNSRPTGLQSGGTFNPATMQFPTDGPPSGVTIPSSFTTELSTTPSAQSTPTTDVSAKSEITATHLSSTAKTAGESPSITAASGTLTSSNPSSSSPTSSTPDADVTSTSLPSSTTLLTDASASSSLLAAASSSSTSGISSIGAANGIKYSKCSSISCDPKLAAAIFVPIAVVLALLGLCFAFFCIRRKGRSRLGNGLAFFSHGAETNYVTPPRSSAGTVSSRSPSMREAEGSFGAFAAAGGAAGVAGLASARGLRRDHDFGRGFVADTSSVADSDCVAPPPYAPRQSTDGNAVEPADVTRHSGLTAPPAAAQRGADPFADPAANPFGDEAGDQDSLLSGDTAVAVARAGGSRRSVRDNASIGSSLRDMDEAGSVHEAMLGNVSRGPSVTGATGGRLGSFRSRSPRPRASS